MAKEKQKKVSMLDAFLPLILMALCVGVGASFLKLNSRILLMFSLTVTILFGYKCGFSWAEMQAGMVKKLTRFAVPAIMLMVLGAFLASTMLSGATPVLVVWLSKLVTPKLILPLSFLLCSLMCTLIGCNWTTCGTLGLVLFSIGTVQGVNPYMLAGAIVSGATFGTYVSPLSDVMINHAAFCDVPVTAFIKEMNRPSYVSLGIVTIMYAILGLFTGSSASVAQVAELQAFTENVSAVYNTNPLVILPIVVCVVMAYKKVPLIPTMLISTFLGVLIGWLFQGFTLATCFKACYNGFSSAKMMVEIAPNVEVGALLAELVDRGGVLDFIGGVITIFLIMANLGVVDLLDPFAYVKKWFFKSETTSLWGLHIKMAAFCTVGMLMIFNTTALLAVAMEIFEEPCKKLGVSKLKVACNSKTWGTMAMNVLPFLTTPLTFAAVFGFDSSLQYYPWVFIFFVISIVMTVMNGLKLNEVTHEEGVVV